MTLEKSRDFSLELYCSDFTLIVAIGLQLEASEILKEPSNLLRATASANVSTEHQSLLLLVVCAGVCFHHRKLIGGIFPAIAFAVFGRANLGLVQVQELLMPAAVAYFDPGHPGNLRLSDKLGIR
jgi:hypothetical protein